MAISWSLRRKLVYSGTTLFVALLIALFVWTRFFNAPPTCFDGKQDGGEAGVDCGGTCSLLCTTQTIDPIVLWARAFPNGTNTYTAAAYLKNDNNAGAHNVHYAFQFFDANSKLVLEKDGVMDIPPIPVVPIVVPSVYTGNRTVVRTLFSLSDTPVWYKTATTTSPLRVVGQTLATDGSRLDATIANNSLVSDAKNIEAVAVLFDPQGIALAASESLVPSVPHQSSANVIFTWPSGVPSAVRAEVTILPSF